MRSAKYDVDAIHENAPEAMMGLFAVQYSESSAAILCSDGEAFVIYLEDYFDDLGQSPPDKDSDKERIVLDQKHLGDSRNFLISRGKIAAQLNTANVSSSILKLRTAAPLNGSGTLNQNTIMYRFTAGQRDICFSNNTSELRKGAYLTPENDVAFVNTGYGVVGRYSLPVPHPARYLHKYLIPGGTGFRVGTVEPQFNQSGGGVEVKLDGPTKVTLISTTRIDDY